MKDELPAVTGDISWQEEALCLGLYHRTGVDLFFPPDNPGGPKRGRGISGESERIRSAKKICARCPVRMACLEFAVANNCSGVWGGTTDSERKALARERAA